MLKAELILDNQRIVISGSSESTKQTLMDFMQEMIIEHNLKQVSKREWTKGVNSLTCNFDVK